jgi:hypothetical protein
MGDKFAFQSTLLESLWMLVIPKKIYSFSFIHSYIYLVATDSVLFIIYSHLIVTCSEAYTSSETTEIRRQREPPKKLIEFQKMNPVVIESP